MADIKTTIDAMSEAVIKPEEPAKPVKPELPDPTKAEIEAVVERLSQPWLYSSYVAKIERELGIPGKTILKIKAEYDRRKAELAPKEVGEVAEGEK